MKNKKIILLITLVIILTAIFAYFLIFKPNTNTNKKDLGFPIKREVKINEENGITFEVALSDFTIRNQFEFEVKITTHSGSLDFDLTQISFLEDDKGNKYLPLEWRGAGPGGHHREGTLIFPKLENKSKSVKLIVEDIVGQPRIFEWGIK